MFDTARRIVVCNRRYAEIVDIPTEVVRPGATLRQLLQLSVAAGHFPNRSADEIEREMWPPLERGAEWHRIFRRNGKDFTITQRITEGGFRVATFEDVTEKLAAEEALQESEAQLKAILDGIPDCVKIFNEAGTLVYINPAGLELLQAPDLESLSRPGFDPVLPDYRKSFKQHNSRVICGEAVAYDYELVGLEGRQRHVEAHAVPLRMLDGSRAQLCISRDVTERNEAEEALRRSEERLRLVQEATGLAEFEVDPDGVATVSDRLLDQCGLPRGDNRLSLDKLLELVDPRDHQVLHATIASSLASTEEMQCEFRIRRADNADVRWISSHVKVKRDSEGNALRSIGAHLDITERKRAEEALRESEQRFRLAAEASGLGVWDYDSQVERQEWSERFREILGVSPEAEPSLSALTELVHPADLTGVLEQLVQIRGARAGERLQGSFRIIRRADGVEHWIALNGWKSGDEAGGQSRIIITIRDITDEKTASEQIRWAATHDALTGLPNRRLFHERLELAIADAKAHYRKVGLLLLDLDQFKQVNDTLGHDVGDMLLRTFSERIASVLRDRDTVARLGGDEFAIILRNIDGSIRLEQLAATIFDRLRAPVLCGGGSALDCRVSVGACLFPDHGQSTGELLKHADLALYSAKSGKHGRMVLFHQELLHELVTRSSMINCGKKAVREDRISPFYQPKIDLRTNEVVGFEALLRWGGRDGAVQLPDTIAAAFDDPDVATAISDRMLDHAIRDMRDWLDRGLDFKSVALNASAAEFRRGGFAEGVLETLEKGGVPPCCLQIEVTETVFLGRGAENVLSALNLLDSEGVMIALDDFGTGYASLRHLKEFPVQLIKIDKSFVGDMVDSSDDEAIVRAVINLGKSLGIKVVAEGVETPAQAARLVEFGCHFAQGYLFSKAVPFDLVSELLTSAVDHIDGELLLPLLQGTRLVADG